MYVSEFCLKWNIPFALGDLLRVYTANDCTCARNYERDDKLQNSEIITEAARAGSAKRAHEIAVPSVLLKLQLGVLGLLKFTMNYELR